MSREAYIERYQQEPPAGAYFGADVSWYQAASSGALSKARCMQCWEDLVQWADWVTIRTSYGRSGNDGGQGLHIQCAQEVGYTGPLGAYHYIVPSAGAGNCQNFMDRWREYEGIWTHEMWDHEEGLDAGTVWECITRFENECSHREGLYYGAKSIADAAGWWAAVRPLWPPHYASSRYVAWAPTTNWNLWQAPYIADAWIAQEIAKKIIWQHGSTSSRHGSLDLNITTSPELVGITGGSKDMPLNDSDLKHIYEIVRSAAADTDGNNQNRAMTAFSKLDALLGGQVTLASGMTRLAELLTNLKTGNVDVNALAVALSASLGPKLATQTAQAVLDLYRAELND